MTDMPVYMHFLYSTIATIGFSVFFNVPKSALIPAGLTGGIGWSIYYCLINATNNDILANFLAAALVALISEILARKLKYPAILFSNRWCHLQPYRPQRCHSGREINPYLSTRLC